MRRSPLVLACCAGIVAAPAALADDAFANTASPLHTYHPLLTAAAPSGPERGNTIALGGPGGAITSLAIRARIGNSGVAQFTAIARLYANDGPAGAPGTLLWSSGPRNLVIDSGADLTYSFPVAGVVAPQTLTWTLQITNRFGQNQNSMGPAHYNPPTIGSALPGVWENGPGGWVQINPGEAPFGARISACYPNCDASTAAPALNVQDFGCFLTRYAAGTPYANCDGSTTAPVLNVQDFGCFLTKYASGCP